jgi:hypothetical protein
MFGRRVGLIVAVSTALVVIVGSVPVAAKTAASTTGSGDIVVLGTMPGSFTYEAIAESATVGKGSLHFVLLFQGLHVEFEGDVTCVTFDAANNRAWVGGVITANLSVHPSYTTARTQVGHDIWFRVVDYGEGTNDPDDRTTFVGFEGDRDIPTSAAYCALQPWVAGDASTWPVVEGNLQVRP